MHVSFQFVIINSCLAFSYFPLRLLLNKTIIIIKQQLLIFFKNYTSHHRLQESNVNNVLKHCKQKYNMPSLHF